VQDELVGVLRFDAVWRELRGGEVAEVGRNDDLSSGSDPRSQYMMVIGVG